MLMASVPGCSIILMLVMLQILVGCHPALGEGGGRGRGRENSDNRWGRMGSRERDEKCNLIEPCEVGAFLPDPENCGRFFRCNTNRRWIFQTCPGGTAFDKNQMMCIHSIDAQCLRCDEDESSDFRVSTVPTRPTKIMPTRPKPTRAHPTGPGTNKPGPTRPKPPVDVVDHILVSPSADMMLEGHQVSLVCDVTLRGRKSKRHVIRWYLNQTEISRSGLRINITDQRVKTGTTRSTLILNPAKWGDSGLYTCAVQLEADVMSSARAVQINVLAHPTVTINPLSTTLDVGGSVIIHCLINVAITGHDGSYQPPEVTWSKDGQAIKTEQANIVNIEKALYDSTLEVAAMEDHVEYGCAASNVAGKSETEICRILGIEQGEEELCSEGLYLGVAWDATPVGEVSVQECPDRLQGESSRRCGVDEEGDPAWEEPDLNECVSPVFNYAAQSVYLLQDGIGSGNVPVENAAKTIESLSASAVTGVGLLPGDLNISIETVSVLSSIHEQNENLVATDTEVESIVGTVSNLLSETNTLSWSSLLQENSSRVVMLMEAMDRYAGFVAKTLKLNEMKEFIADNLVLQAGVVSKHSTDDVTVPIRNITKDDWFAKSRDHMTVSKDTLQEIAAGISEESVILSCNQYRTLEDFLPGLDNTTLGSKILSLTVENVNQSLTFDNPIEMYFEYSINVSLDGFIPECAFWNYSIGTSGSWSSQGCTLVAYNSSGATCSCNHLTNFGIIISPHRPTGIHFTVLSILSIMGCLISIIALVLTIVVYTVLWKEIRSHHTIVFMNLCVALILANVVFLAGVERTDPPGLCTFIAALLHYLYLAVFFIMLAEGAELILYIIFVFHVKRMRETLMLLTVGWGLPAVIVGITFAATKSKGYGNEDFCWLTTDNGVLWAFVGPATLVICVNIVILILVLRRIFHSNPVNPSAKKRDNSKYKSTFWNLVVLMPLMGISWIFGLFAINDKTLVFQYIFAILNSFQGLFIFLFHCAFNKRVREACTTRFQTDTSSSSSTKPVYMKPLLRKNKGRYNVQQVTRTTPVLTSQPTTEDSIRSSSRSAGSTKSLLSKQEKKKQLQNMENGNKESNC